MRQITELAIALAALSAPYLSASASKPYPDGEIARAVVADFTNTSRDRHTVTAHAATEAIAQQLAKSGIYDVVSRSEVEHAALARGYHPPFTSDELVPVAQDLGATVIVYGDIKDVSAHSHDGQREVDVTVIVRARGVSSEDLVNGAAERGAVTSPKDSTRTDGELLIDAATMAAGRAATRMSDYKPVKGTILSSQLAFGSMVLNRGVGDGVKRNQEFMVMRNGSVVGRVRAVSVSDSYSELAIVDDAGGVHPQDQVVSIFPEPKLGH